MQNKHSQPALTVKASREQSRIEAPAFQQWSTQTGTEWAFFYRVENDYLLRFPSLADFRISNDGQEVTAFPVHGVSQQTVDHLYLNQVLPLALSRQGKLVLHACAIEVENFSVAFLGSSGRGKSTLAASFSTNGYRFLTDDGLQIEKELNTYLALPSHPSIRLWEDSGQNLIPDTTELAPPVDYTPKSRFLAGGGVAFCSKPRPLRAVYSLGEGRTDRISIEMVSCRDAMIEMIKHSFLLDIDEREMLARHFGQLSELVRVPMFFRLDYPRRYEMLREVRQAVVGHVTKLP